MRARFRSLLQAWRRRLPSEPVLGVAWYRPEQWMLLRKSSADAERLEPMYGQWLKTAEARYEDMVRQKMNVKKVTVDVVDMAAWCSEMGRPMDGAGRAAYVAYKLHDERAEASRPSATPPGPRP